MAEKLAYTLHEAAESINVSYPTIRTMMREYPNFPYFRNGREYRIPCSSFKKFIEEISNRA